MEETHIQQPEATQLMKFHSSRTEQKLAKYSLVSMETKISKLL